MTDLTERYLPLPRARRLRFAPLGLGACLGTAVAALLVAATQNPNRPFFALPTAAGLYASHAPIVDTQGGDWNAMASRGLGGAEQLYARFVASGYTLARVRGEEAEVPRVMLSSLPADLAQVGSTDMRKTVFIKMMLPLLLAENERILADRQRVNALRDRIEQGQALTGSELDWLGTIASRYGVDNSDFDGLLRRIDAIPPSLAIAQAALETGWGTSRVAHYGHAMFGQMETRGVGEESIFAVKFFDDLAGAVTAYAYNLNTHRAYNSFRGERARFRGRGLAPDGHELALHIARYSERGMDYVRDVRVIIRTNNLRPLDPARLAG